MSDSNPASTSPPTSRKVLGLPLWLFVLLLFGVAGVVAWQTGTLDPLIAKLNKSGKPAAPVNINTASLEELRALPSIDEKLAAEIIKERPFESVDDITKVKGIGEKKLEKLRPLITVQ
jgi:competence protein ComEA